MDAKKHPHARYENLVTRERLPAQNVERSGDAREYGAVAFVR